MDINCKWVGPIRYSRHSKFASLAWLFEKMRFKSSAHGTHMNRPANRFVLIYFVRWELLSFMHWKKMDKVNSTKKNRRMNVRLTQHGMLKHYIMVFSPWKKDWSSWHRGSRAPSFVGFFVFRVKGIPNFVVLKHIRLVVFLEHDWIIFPFSWKCIIPIDKL